MNASRKKQLVDAFLRHYFLGYAEAHEKKAKFIKTRDGWQEVDYFNLDDCLTGPFSECETPGLYQWNDTAKWFVPVDRFTFVYV